MVRPEKLRLRHGGIDEFLPQLVVGEALDLPFGRGVAVLAGLVGRAEHHQHRPPPAIQRVLRHRLLLFGAARQRQHDLKALALVEGFFLADADHRARIGTIGTAAQRDLVHDRRAIDQPADRADVGPGQRRIIEDRGILGFPRQHQVDQFFARGAERLGGGVEIEPVAAFVLHLGEQRGLAAQRRRAGDPVAFGQHADDFGMGVLGNLPRQRLAIGRGHPVVRLDALLGIDARLKLRGARGVLDVAVFGIRRVERLRVHGRPPGSLLGVNI